jgi:hypothetical protein
VLADFQRDFAAALLDPDDDAASRPQALRALVAQPGFAVYRNTVAHACIEALRANFPVVRELVGDAWFDAAATAFHRRQPPGDGRLAVYGEGFPGFLVGYAPAADLPYLQGVARFDRLWCEAHVAADAPPLDVAAFAGLDAAALAAARLVPHVAARWAGTDAVPSFSIWRRLRDRSPLGAPLEWRGDGGLLSRPGDAVDWIEVDAGAIAFLDACAAGHRFGDAVEALGDAVGATLPALIVAGAFGRLLR